MKAIIIKFWQWLISLFRKKKPTSKKTYVIPPDPVEEKRVRRKKVPQHNNRKKTRGRKVQYVNSGSSFKNRQKSRTIFKAE